MTELKPDITLAAALRLTAQSFRQAGIEEAEADARVLIGRALKLDRAKLIAQEARELDASEIDVIAGLVARRRAREPVARILGEKEFWSLPLGVSDVLVPRPETETVIELALDLIARDGRRIDALRILDIGTGSGALLLALLSELPNAVGIGTDISVNALATARANAARNGLAGRCRLLACDVAAGLNGRYDLIVANPPYISSDGIGTLAPEVRDHDPWLALDGGSDGLSAYRALAAAAHDLLAPGARLIVELGIGQEPLVSEIFTKVGIATEAVRSDLAGVARALAAKKAPGNGHEENALLTRQKRRA